MLVSSAARAAVGGAVNIIAAQSTMESRPKAAVVVEVERKHRVSDVQNIVDIILLLVGAPRDALGFPLEKYRRKMPQRGINLFQQGR